MFEEYFGAFVNGIDTVGDGVRSLLDEPHEFVLRDEVGVSHFDVGFVVVVSGGSFLGGCIIVRGVLGVLTKCGYEDVCSVLAEDCGECVDPVNQAVGGAKLHALFIRTHYVNIVNQRS